MSSVTGNVVNNTGFTVIAKANPPIHGSTTILHPTIPARSSQPREFVANSDGVGAEGSVSLTGGGVTFTLIYDSPTVGSNSCSVTAPSGYTGSCQVGAGTNATFTYTIGPA
jgi:hypothetical protein